MTIIRPAAPGVAPDAAPLKRIFTQGGLSFMGHFINKIFIFFFYVLAARLLGATQFGIFSLVVVVFNFSFLVAKLGTDNGLLRFIGLYSSENQRNEGKVGEAVSDSRITGTIYISLMVTIIAGSLAYLAVGVWGRHLIGVTLFNEPRMAPVLMIGCLGLPFALVVEVMGKSGIALGTIAPQILCRNVLVPLLRLAAVLILYFAGTATDMETIGAVYSGTMVVGAVFMVLYFIVKKRELISAVPGNVNGRKYLVFCMMSMGIGLSLLVFNLTDSVMLGIFSGAREVGIYSAGKNIAFNLTIINGSLALVFSPLVAGYFAEKNFEAIRKQYQNITTLSFVVNLPVFLVLFVFSLPVLGIFGPGFAVWDGGITLKVLAVGYFLNGMMLHSNFSVLMGGYSRPALYYHLAAMSLNVALNLLLIPRFGAIGAAMATLGAIILLNGLFIYKAYSLTGINPLPEKAGICLLALLLLYAAFVFVEQYERGLFVVGLAGLAAYGVVIPGYLALSATAKEYIAMLMSGRKGRRVS